MQKPRPKFTVQTHTMNFESKTSHIANSVPCVHHGALVGFPCWGIIGDNGQYLNAICNQRTLKMYRGKISDFAKRTHKPSKKEHHS